MIDGKLCHLRPVEPEDLEQIRQWRSSKDVHPFFPSWDPISAEGQRQWYERISQSGSTLLFVIETKQKKAVGVIFLMELDRRNRRAEFGYYLGESSARRSGIAIEAEQLLLDYCFHYLNLKKVYCESMAFNTNVLGIHSQFGFQKDGRLRAHAFRNGQYHDMIHMSLLDTEYEAKRPQVQQLIEKLAER